MRINLLDTFPVVVSHLQWSTDDHTNPDAHTITDDHVQQPRIPPAFLEVGQQMGKHNLKGKENGILYW